MPAPVPSPLRRKRFFLAAVAIGVLLTAWSLRPRRQQIELSDGSRLVVDRVTAGPNHSRPAPLTWNHLRVALRNGSWPRFTETGPDNSVALWIDESLRPQVRDKLVLVDRYGWRWSPYRSSLGVSPIVFPTMESTAPLNLEVVQGTDVIRRVTLTPPARNVSPVAWEAETLPLERRSGRLGFRLESFDIQTHEGPPSGCSGRARMSMTWNGHPIRPRMPSLRFVDSLWREDDHWDWGIDGKFGTDLSPHGVLWRVHVLIGRSWTEPLEPDEEVLLEPDTASPTPVQSWDRTVAGIPCRITWTDAAGKVAIPSRFSGPDATWYALGAKVTVELPPEQRMAAPSTSLRIDFVAPDGSIAHRGIVEAIPRSKGLWGANTGAAKLPERCRIRVGIDLLQTVEFTVKPRIVGPTAPR